jgi:hypothetical protein
MFARLAAVTAFTSADRGYTASSASAALAV